MCSRWDGERLVFRHDRQENDCAVSLEDSLDLDQPFSLRVAMRLMNWCLRQIHSLVGRKVFDFLVEPSVATMVSNIPIMALIRLILPGSML